MAETANVEVMVQAFTEAAQESLDDMGDEFQELATEAQPAEAAADDVADGLDSAERSAEGAGDAFDDVDAAALAASMQLLANRSAEAGEQIRSAGRRAGVTSAAFGGLSAASTVLAGALSALSLATTVSLIPAIVTLGTVLLPLTAILGGLAAGAAALAAAFGAVVAVPAAQNMDTVKEALAEANQEIVQILKPMADRFLPLLLDAIDALPDLVRNVLDAVGGFQGFADALRELGQRAFEVIPQVAAFMHDLATDALPVFMDFIDSVGNTAPGLIQATQEAFERLGPPLRDFLDALVDATPRLFDLGLIVGETVIPKLTRLVEVTGNLAGRGVNALRQLGDGMQRLAVGGVIAAPVIGKLAAVLVSLVGGPITLAIGAVAALATAYMTNFRGIRDTVDSVVSDVMDIFSDFSDTFDANVDTLVDVTQSFRQAFDAAISGVMSVQDELRRNVQGLVRQYLRLWQDASQQIRPIIERVGRVLDENQDKIQELGRIAGRAVNGIVTVLRETLLPAARYVFLNLIIPILDRVTRVWAENFGEILQETIETINAVQNYVQPALNRMEQFWTQHGDAIMEVVRFAFDIIVRLVGTQMDALVTAILVAMNLIQGDWDEAWTELSDFAQRRLDGLQQFVDKWFGGFIEGVSSWFDNLVSDAVTGVNEFVNGIVRGLIAIRDGFVNLFTNQIPNAVLTGLALLVGHVQSGMNQVHNTMVSVWEGILSVGESAVNQLINNTISALNAFLSTLDETADAVSDIPGVDAPDVGTLEQQTIDTQGLEAERRETDAQALAEQTRQDLEGELELNISGDGALADLLREEAEATVERKERERGRRGRRRGVTET